MISMLNRDSRETSGEDASSLAMYHLWGRPYSHVLPFGFPILFLLLGLLPAVLLSYMILWVCWGPVPPLPSCLPIVCIIYTWRIPLSIHDSWYPSWLSSVWTSHPRLVSTCHAKNIFSSSQCWEIGCHISSLKTSYLGAQHLFLSFPSLDLCSCFMLLSFHINFFYFVFIFFLHNHIGIIIHNLVVPYFHPQFFFAPSLPMVESHWSVWFWFFMMLSLRPFSLYSG